MQIMSPSMRGVEIEDEVFLGSILCILPNVNKPLEHFLKKR